MSMIAATAETQCARSIAGSQPAVLTEIYRDDANIVIWQRDLSAALALAAGQIVNAKPALQTSAIVPAEHVHAYMLDTLGTDSGVTVLHEDMAELVDMYCCLFELKRVGLRISVLNRAMCPRFHVDHVPCRLVTTYHGHATEWLPHHLVDRTKLGAGNQGKADDQSGLYQCAQDIQYLKSGDVALLKGERWQGNENAGLVHRSPQLNPNQPRLLLTIDSIE